MMNTDTEVLYLARGERDIFVEKCPRQQHVIDGIRFLYRQYAKKKPGVIINNTERTSNRIQTVLFINAVHLILDRPALILCEEGMEKKWLELFGEWTNMAHDITADTINPFAKKVSVYVTPITEMGKFYSRDWSVLIVDTDIIHKEILKDKLNARYKIWITCVDVKKNLNIFFQIYKWLYPKQTFDVNIFKTSKNNSQEKFSTEIMLEAFMEDIVVKSDIFLNNVNNNFMSSSPPSPKITRKNKDPTGLKVKRTKRKIRISSTEDSPNKSNKTSNENSNFNIEPSSFNVGEDIDNINVCKNLTSFLNDTVVNNTEMHIEYDDDDVSSNKDQRDNNSETSKTENAHNDERLEVTNDRIDKMTDEDENSMNLLLQYDEDSTNLIIDEKMESNNSEIYDNDTQINELDNVEYLNENTKPTNESENLTVKKESEDMFSTESISNLNKQTKVDTENEFSESKDEKMVVKDNKTERSIDTSSVEYKMKQIEELAMKKFKGSLLDSLF